MRRPLFCATLALLAALSAFAGTAAQTPPAAPAKPQIENFGDWVVRCFPVQSASPCDMLFATVKKATGQRVTSLSIAYIPSGNRYVMQLAVPSGVALSAGAVIEAQGYRSGSLFFRRCDRAGCFVEMAISPELIAGLKAAADPQGRIDVVADGGKPVSRPISLKGFGSAHDAMVDLAKQKAQNSTPPAAPNQPAPAPQP